VTAEYLFKLRPGSKEGEMTQIRSAMVNTNTLAALAEELGLGSYLYLGKGIARGGGRSLRSLLANAFEAVLGAIFLDAGYDAAYHYYLDRFRALPEPVQDENHKGRLQQVVQERFGQTPYYDSVSARGGRQREYTAVVYAGAEPLGTGHGVTKQGAEQDAARNALAELNRRDAAGKPPRRSRRREPATVETPPEPVEGSPSGSEVAAAAGLAEAVAEGSLDGAPVEVPVPEAAPADQPKARRSRRRKPAATGTEQAEQPEQPEFAAVAEQAAPAVSRSRRGGRRRRPASESASDAASSESPAPASETGGGGAGSEGLADAPGASPGAPGPVDAADSGPESRIL
jgi:ribonuclease-3